MSDHVHMDMEQRVTSPVAVPLVSSYSQSMGNAAPRSDFAQPITPIKQSPWGVPSGPPPRPSPFDADIPTSRNLPVVKQPSPPPARAVTWQESHNNVQAWLTDSQRASGNEWAQIPEDPKSTIESDVHTVLESLQRENLALLRMRPLFLRQSGKVWTVLPRVLT